MRKFLKFLPWALALIFFYTLQKSSDTLQSSPQGSNNNSPQVEYIGSPSASPRDLQTHKVTKIVDGDTIEIDGKIRVRYIGIDTPEVGNCFADQATQANRNLVYGKEIQLEYDIQKQDRYGRDLAYVFVDNKMVNQELIRQGYAKLLTIPPNIRYVDTFKSAQKYAQDNKLGLWADNACQTSSNSFIQEAGASGTVQGAHTSCLIKGNINSSGEKIYHEPGQRYYEKTQVEENKGEKWFCSASEAEQAGWRKSKI